jgi:hypothetical protein
MALLVLVTSVMSCLLDQAFQTTAAAQFGRRAMGGSVIRLQRLFSAYGLVSALATLGFQLSVGRLMLTSAGAVASVAAMPAVVGVSTLAVFAFPSVAGRFISLAAARLVEATTRSALFRPGFELLFGAVSSPVERSAKTTIDTTVERSGDIAGGLLVQAVLLLAPSAQVPAMLLFAVALCAIAIPAAVSLQVGYSDELEKTLRRDVATVEAATLTGQVGAESTVMELPTQRMTVFPPRDMVPPTPESVAGLTMLDPTSLRRMLAQPVPLNAVEQVAMLLGDEAIKNDVIRALRRTLPDSASTLGRLLVDRTVPFAVRRRIPPVLSDDSSAPSVRALEGGLLDPAFELRERSGRALARMRRYSPALGLDPRQLLAAVQLEVDVDRDVWAARDGLKAMDEVDEATLGVVTERADRSLRHLETVLGLLYPERPIEIVFDRLRGADKHLRGTAIEYLEAILPQAARKLCLLLDVQARSAPPRPADDLLSELLVVHPSIAMRVADAKSGSGR